MEETKSKEEMTFEEKYNNLKENVEELSCRLAETAILLKLGGKEGEGLGYALYALIALEFTDGCSPREVQERLDKNEQYRYIINRMKELFSLRYGKKTRTPKTGSLN